MLQASENVPSLFPHFVAFCHCEEAKCLLLNVPCLILQVNRAIMLKAGCDLVNYVIEKLEQ